MKYVVLKSLDQKVQERILRGYDNMERMEDYNERVNTCFIKPALSKAVYTV